MRTTSACWLRVIVFAVASVLAWPILAQAHIFRAYTYQELFAEADLVAIARPVTKTSDTPERTYYADIVTQEDDGTQTKVPAIGVETKFEVLAILKGAPLKGFVLHHYRDVPSRAVSFGGASTVFFDPADTKQAPEYLLFLVRETDGRYAPVGGQTDPDGSSIMSVSGVHNR